MKKQDIYNYIKGLLPNKIRIFLSIIKRQIQNIVESGLMVRGWFWKRHTKTEPKGLVTVCFVAVEPQTWNSLKPVYDAMKEDDRFNPYIITVPNKDGVKEMKYFLEEANYEIIDAFESESVLDIRTLSPDIIFIQTPYDWMYPVQYRSKNLVKVAPIYYIPYCYDLCDGEHLDVQYHRLFLSNVSCIFASNSYEYKYCLNKLKRSIYTSNIMTYDVGYPRFDICANVVQSDRIMTFTWFPRWNFYDSTNYKSSFLKYFDVLKKYFDNHKSLRLIIRPHPMMFDYILTNGILSVEEVNKIKKSINLSDNIQFDTNYDYYETFKETDVLISDHSSLLAEFYFMKKPILYCGEYTGYNNITKKMLDEFVRIDSIETLIYNLDQIQDKNFYNEKRCSGNPLSEKNIASSVAKQISDVCYSLCTT